MNVVTKKGAIVPHMSTWCENDNLSATLFGKTRLAVLSLLYTQPDETFYWRQLVRAAGVGLGAVQREVRRLSDAGIIRRMVRGRHVYYQANSQCPVFEELRRLVVKTAGVGDILRSGMALLADRINFAFVYGSVACGEQYRGSDLDMLVVGDVTFAEIVSALGGTQEKLGREINPTVYSPAEFRSKLKTGHHFLKAALGGIRIFLIGDERELARLADCTPDQRPRDPGHQSCGILL